jgi:hypothetical protein
MNLLSGYGSDSDNQDNSDSLSKLKKNEPKSQSNDFKGSAKASNVNGPQQSNKGKKKIELLSLLPANIQAALQGDTLYDSDSDNERGKPFSKGSIAASSSSSSSSVPLVSSIKSSNSSLLSILPRAQDGNNELKASLVTTNVTTTSKFAMPLESSGGPNDEYRAPPPQVNSKFAMPLESSGGPNDEYRAPPPQVKSKFAMPLESKSETKDQKAKTVIDSEFLDETTHTWKSKIVTVKSTLPL